MQHQHPSNKNQNKTVVNGPYKVTQQSHFHLNSQPINRTEDKTIILMKNSGIWGCDPKDYQQRQHNKPTGLNHSANLPNSQSNVQFFSPIPYLYSSTKLEKQPGQMSTGKNFPDLPSFPSNGNIQSSFHTHFVPHEKMQMAKSLVFSYPSEFQSSNSHGVSFGTQKVTAESNHNFFNDFKQDLNKNIGKRNPSKSASIMLKDSSILGNQNQGNENHGASSNCLKNHVLYTPLSNHNQAIQQPGLKKIGHNKFDTSSDCIVRDGRKADYSLEVEYAKQDMSFDYNKARNKDRNEMKSSKFFETPKLIKTPANLEKLNKNKNQHVRKAIRAFNLSTPFKMRQEKSDHSVQASLSSSTFPKEDSCDVSSNTTEKSQERSQSSTKNQLAIIRDYKRRASIDSANLLYGKNNTKQDSSLKTVQKKQDIINQSLHTYPPQKQLDKSLSRSNYSNHQIDVQKSSASKQNITLESFQKIKQLGNGKYGKVFLVRQRSTNFICALKQIEKKVLYEQQITEQFIRQLKIQTFLNHPNIIKMYGFFQDKDNIYTILEAGTGGQLYHQLKKMANTNPNTPGIPESKVAYYMRQVCQAVNELHSYRIIHRDIKPENIVLHDNVIKLCDFGWSVRQDTNLRTTFCGTPLYVCPEILKGKEYDEKIDIWSLGIMMYQMVVGQNPFKITREEELVKIIKDQLRIPQYAKVSSDIENLLSICLRKNPDDRVAIRELIQHDFFKKYPDKQIQKNKMVGL